MPPAQLSGMSERLLAGDDGVLEEILLAFGPAVRAVLGRRYAGLLSRDDIDDVLAVALYRLWEHRRRFDDEKGSLRVWLFRIADNAARDVLRLGWHKARRLEVVSDPGTLASLADHRHNGRTNGRPTPPDEHDMMDERQAVREILDTLPEKQRRILLADALARDGTASSDLLADELDIPPGTVRVYRKRALERVRAELRQRGFDVP